jgi:hypothetical protein
MFVRSVGKLHEQLFQPIKRLFGGREMKRRGLNKRTLQVIQLAVLRDALAQERASAFPSGIAIARLEREFAELSTKIINDLLAAHDRDMMRIKS